MDPNKLNEVAHQIRELLKSSDIEFNMFNIKIRVTKEYYDSIKDNFLNRPPVDIIVGAGEEDWHIELLYSPTLSKLERNEDDSV